MTCKVCGSELKTLFTSSYCPNEDNHGRADLPWEELDDLWVAQCGDYTAGVVPSGDEYAAYIACASSYVELDGFPDTDTAKEWCERKWDEVIDRIEHPAFPYVG